jgi:hypothetical protein
MSGLNITTTLKYIPTETTTGMFQSATPSSADTAMKSLIVPIGDDTAVTVLNNDHKKDSEEPHSDIALDVLLASTGIAPNTATLPVQNTDETISSKPIEVTTAVNNESAITAAGSGGNNEIALVFPQRVSHKFGNPFTFQKPFLTVV